MSARLRFDEASLHCEEMWPGKTLLRSTDIGWTSLLVNLFRCDVAGGIFDIVATTDERISLLVKGKIDVDVQQSGFWKRTALRPGSALMIPGGHSLRMKWSGSQPAEPPEIINVYLPRALMVHAAEGCALDQGHRRPGVTASPSIRDPVVATVGSSLLTAMRLGAPDLYAETAARWLATHLTCVSRNWEDAGDAPLPDAIADANVARAIRYMSSNLAEPLTLDALASEAGISKFHFTRRFKKRTGATPFAHLLALRLEAGRRMLATTDDPVGRVANACGYERGSHFGTAFARRYGETPTAFRRRSRSRQSP